MENSLPAIFDEIWLKTLYYSTGSLAQFLSRFKIHNKYNIDWNQLIIHRHHIYMHMHYTMHEK